MKSRFAIAFSVFAMLMILPVGGVRRDVIRADWIGEAHTAESDFGTEIAAGDFNGDGYIDILVGAYTYTNIEQNEGASYIFFGTPSGISRDAGWMWESNLHNQHAGRAVGNAGDVNGDGIDDIILGAPSFSNDPADGSTAGAFLFYGSSSGPRPAPDWEHFSHLHGDRFGRAVGTAGDVNGDGYADVIIGSYYWDGGEVNEGGVWVIHGSKDGVPRPTECTKCHGGGSMWRAESNQAEAGMAWGASTAGDLNGDGYDDVIVGAPSFALGHVTPSGQPKQTDGAVFVYLGSPTGLSVTPHAVLPAPDGGSQFGRTVSDAGDVNGDGYSDIIVGARRFDRDSRSLKEGAAVVYHGSPTGIVERPAWLMVGKETQGFFGHAVGGAGDVNGDGYSDVLVGEQLAVYVETPTSSPSDTSTRVGRVHVYLGSPTGLSTTAAWSLDGDQPGADFGIWVEPAGDVDGDRLGDILVGAWRYDNDQIDEGRVFLYYGSTLTAHGIEKPHRAVRGDHDGDGHTDLLWAYSDSGYLALSMANNAGISHTELLQMSADHWRMAGAGDYNGDGRADIIQQDTNDGQVRISFMDGNVVVSQGVIRDIGDTTVRVIGSGDFNSDERDDVLWYNAVSGEFYVTLMDGTRVISGRRLLGISDPDAVLHVAGIGDFNNDGIDDIVWNNARSSDVIVTLLRDFRIIDERRLYNSVEVPWKIAGIGDFNGDRNDDLMLWDSSNGNVHLVTMNGALGTHATRIAGVSGCEPVGLGNFDNGQTPDIIWRCKTRDEMLIWIMNGLRVRQSIAIGSGLGPSWKIMN